MNSCAPFPGGQYNPPLAPWLPAGSAIPGLNRGPMAMGRNPFFTIANQYLPRNLNDVIRWSRYITTQSPVTTEVIRKLSTYPITDFVVGSSKRATKAKYEEIFKSLDLKSALHDIGFEHFSLGNVFVSIYFPIHRTLVCPHCAQEYYSKASAFLKFVNYEFEGECPACSLKGKFIRKDTKSFNIEDLNLVKWDPMNITVNHNPITNEYEYYYKIPNEIKRKVRMGDRLFVDSIPWAFVEAIKNNQDFKFDRNNIFHLRNLSTGQLVEGVAIPPLISQFNLVFYQATLRKANESVAQDYMAPLRVIYPQPQTGNSDPVISISMKNFSQQMQKAFIRHKTDNNAVVFAPVPVGYQAISGEGKALLVTQEIAQAEESSLLSQGVSRELLSGTTNWTSSTVGLRMLENTLQCYVGQVEKLIDWVMSRISKYLGLEMCDVTLTPFRLTDDDNMRQVLLSLVQTGNASLSSLYDSYGMDYQKELDKIRQDSIDKAVNDAKTQMEIERAVFIASREAADKFDQDNEYKTGLQQAQQIAEQMLGMSDTEQRSLINQIKVEDFAMYLMVSKLLEEYKRSATADMANQMAAMGPEGAGAPGAGSAGAGGAGSGVPGVGGSVEPPNPMNPPAPPAAP